MYTILRAIELATTAHASTNRKFSNDPYVLHPLRVVKETYSLFERNPQLFHDTTLEIMLSVAVLHDVPEDTEFTIAMILNLFGHEIADGVEWLTNPSKQRPELPRPDRKKMDRDHITAAPLYIKAIKKIDRADNLHDFRHNQPDFVLDTYIPESLLLKEA